MSIKPEDCLKYDVCEFKEDDACFNGCDYRIEKDYKSGKQEEAWEKLKREIKEMLDMHRRHNRKMRMPSLQNWNAGVIAGLQITLSSMQKIEKELK